MTVSTDGEIWRLAITHRTELTYPEPVSVSYNELRMQPCDEPGQSVLSSFVETDPFEGVLGFWDYFGTRVAAFDLHRPHRQLTITASATVERYLPDAARPPALSWDDLAASDCQDTLEEYLAPTRLTVLDDELDTVAAYLRERAESPAAAAQQVSEWVFTTMTYEPGSTTIHTSAVEAYADRRGVCQDLTHLGIGLLRAMGVPARYVSGYLHPNPAAAIGTTLSGESHAWFEAWDGAWTGHDPTHASPVGLGHVLVGRGRDYADTPPIRGVHGGGEASGNNVEVQLTRLR